jgi:hypothetical protein
MPPRDPVPEPWLSFLRELDRLVTTTTRLDCTGGFVVTMLYRLARPTADVDVLEIAPLSAANSLAPVAMQGGALHRKYGAYLDRVTVAQAPYEYESRLVEMFPGVFEHLHFMGLDPYDLALTKLQRNIERDRSDVQHLARAVPFDLAGLRERYASEPRPYLGNPRRENLTLDLWIEAIEGERVFDNRVGKQNVYA